MYRKRKRRSRKGAWIEMKMAMLFPLLLLRRSRKGAWIEIFITDAASSAFNVAPVRERGLKSLLY